MTDTKSSDFEPEDNGHADAFEASHPAAPRPEPPDPFDPSSLHLGSDYGKDLGVRKVITTIPCRKSRTASIVRRISWRSLSGLLSKGRFRPRSC
jgi:hypothetical protein